MLKSTTSAFVLALFLNDAQAIKYRPYVNGRTPWYKEYAKEPKVDHDINYPVPNFGVDHDIESSLTHTAAAEAKYKHTFAASFKAPKGHPINYAVPNFGVDKDIKNTQQHISEAETDLKHKFTASFKPPKGHPVDYAVPNFGVDRDIKSSLKHTADAEKSLNHKFTASFKPPKGHPINYAVANFGMDKDIITSLKNTENAETKLKVKWNPPALAQTEEEINLESDPVCSSAGCTQYKHKKAKLGYPINYPVPNLGTDPDMAATMQHEKLASTMVNHNWEFGTEESKAKYHNKAKDTQYDTNPTLEGDMIATAKHLGDTEKKLKHKWVIDDKKVQLGEEENVEVESDPICSSAGCTQYKHKKAKLGYPINYPVANNGPDPDMVATMEHEKLASTMNNHNWEFGTEESKAKWHNVAKDTMYDYNPTLEGDMIATAKHLGDTEKKLKHKWVIDDKKVQLEDDEAENVEIESDPICSSAGCTQYKHKKKKLGYPINYPVPNNGPDPDMVATLEHEKLASAMVNHNWEFGTEESKAKWHNKAKDTLYDYSPTLDGDMISTAKHLEDTQKRLKHKWVIDDLQVDEEMNLDSDPICSSAGCTQYKHKKKKLGYPINYPVPNNGPDPDMVDTLQHEKLASAMVNHNWEFGTEESKAKWHNKAKDTLYDYSPTLDGDMISTAKHLEDTQKRLKHKWVIDDLQTDDQMHLF